MTCALLASPSIRSGVIAGRIMYQATAKGLEAFGAPSAHRWVCRVVRWVPGVRQFGCPHFLGTPEPPNE